MALALCAQADRELFAKPQSSRPTPLPVEQAFGVMPPERNGDRLKIEWNIAPGCFLYRSKLEVRAIAPAGAKLGTVEWPQGEPHHDENLGDDQIYRNNLTAVVNGAAKVTRVHVRYQGCADIGICYPPQERDLDVAAGGAS
jgi:thiol:disulfide interchange protein DsbD